MKELLQATVLCLRNTVSPINAMLCSAVVLMKLWHSPSFPCVDRRQGQEGEEGTGNEGGGAQHKHGNGGQL